MRKASLIILISVAVSIYVGKALSSDNPTWTSKISIAKDRYIVFHWVSVYEGQATVFKVEVFQGQERAGQFNVEGQPVFNHNKSLVAFPYCADDGCVNKIDVIDLISIKKLKSITLNYIGQFYIDCFWEGNVLLVREETYNYSDGKEQKTIVSERRFDVLKRGHLK